MDSRAVVYLGPRLRRLRRDLGLTQSDMASDLAISPSYVALLERNQRPITADLLLRIARTYRIDIAELASGNGEDYAARLKGVLADPMFADLDLPAIQNADIATNFPGLTEAFLRVYTSYREEQQALADRSADGATDAADGVAEARRFLTARRNSFPRLDDAAERLARAVSEAGSLASYLKAKHRLGVMRLPSSAMGGSLRRLDRHHERIFLDDGLDSASQSFQLATQLAYLELRSDIQALAGDGQFRGDNGRNLTERSLAGYAAAAILMPYDAFLRAAEERAYDLEALGRQFGASFEQVAHRLTTLQKPGHAGVPFFFIRVDQAGNVSKRLDGAGFPFARHGGGCPLWTVHQVFATPRRVVTQWLELPDGQRFFSIARTVTSGVGGYDSPRVERAIALACGASDAHRLIYARGKATEMTPIGVTCTICQRTRCPARSAPPIGRQVLLDDIRRADVPFGFADG